MYLTGYFGGSYMSSRHCELRMVVLDELTEDDSVASGLMFSKSTPAEIVTKVNATIAKSQVLDTHFKPKI